MPHRRCASTSKTIALVGFTPEVQAVAKQTLRGDGDHVHWLPVDDRTDRALAQLRPDLVVLQTDPRSGAWRLLDALRDSPHTEATPAIVLGDLERQPERLPVTRNVHAVLPLPCDLAELNQAVHSALARARYQPMEAPPPVELEP